MTREASIITRGGRLSFSTCHSAPVTEFIPMAIRILVTGGTFDKEYNEHTGQLFFKDTHIAEMLRLGRSQVEVTIRTIMMVDSLEMTDADRALIVQNCVQSEEARIVIT